MNENLQDIKTMCGSFIVKYPGPDSTMCVHQDMTLVDETKYTGINIWCPLIYLNDENGVIQVLKGSHRIIPTYRGATVPCLYGSMKDEEIIPFLAPVYLKAGQAVIFDQSIIHYSAANLSDKTRITTNIYFTHKDADFRIAYYNEDLHGDKVELYEEDDCFMTNFEQFGDNIFDKPKIGTSLANCNAERYAINKERMMRLSEYSRDCLRTLRAETGIHYEERTRGTVQLFRSQAQLDAAQRDIEVLQECGVGYELLSPEALASAEPALAKVRGKLSGGLRLPNDETGDCHLFTRRLADKARELGVEFRFGQQIRGLVSEGGRISGVRVGDEVLGPDHFVLALGSYSREMLAPLGLDLPVYPVKGYSLTIPLVDAAAAPVSTVLDETYKIAITRFDDRIRVGGMAELAGFDLGLNPRRRETLEMVVADLFPGSGDLPKAEFWTGQRPMTPDGTPIIGETRYDNLYFPVLRY